MSCCLDRFPIEIFHLIFEYLWAHELLYSFRNINGHLNNILSNYNNYLVNFQSIHKSHFDLVCRYMRPKQVISLILSDETETPNQSQLFHSLFSIKEFTRLRVLKLIKLDDNGKSFLSDLPKVPHLMSLEIDVKIDFPLIKSSPLLERVIINIPEGVHFNIDRSIAMIRFQQLRELSLSECSCAQLQEIFRQAVRLSTLKLSFTFINSEEIQRFINFHRGQITTTASSLVSLSLFLSGGGHVLTLDQVEPFLAPLKRLRRLELVVTLGAGDQFVDAHRWEKFILEHLSRLVTFNFKFSVWSTDETTINQYRRPFWLDRQWYVACDHNFVFTVPYFASTSMNNSSPLISPDCTTLPVEQHHIFYDSVTQLTYDSDRCKLPYRYNHVKKLYLRSPYTCDNVLDLSKVQILIVNTSEWSFDKIIKFIKQSMTSVNHLSLNCVYPNMRNQHFSNISLEQIRILSLPEYGKFEGSDSFNWSRLFPRVEQLTASINSKSQLRFLIGQFKNMLNGYFFLDYHYMNMKEQIQITPQWLETHIYRTRDRTTTSFTCRIDSQYSFSLRLWINDNDELVGSTTGKDK